MHVPESILQEGVTGDQSGRASTYDTHTLVANGFGGL